MKDLSSFGTFVNGCRVPPKGFVIIKDKASVMLTMRHVFSLRWTADSARDESIITAHAERAMNLLDKIILSVIGTQHRV